MEESISRGLKPGFEGAGSVRAEARTYLRSKGKGNTSGTKATARARANTEILCCALNDDGYGLVRQKEPHAKHGRLWLAWGTRISGMAGNFGASGDQIER